MWLWYVLGYRAGSLSGGFTTYFRDQGEQCILAASSSSKHQTIQSYLCEHHGSKLASKSLKMTAAQMRII